MYVCDASGLAASASLLNRRNEVVNWIGETKWSTFNAPYCYLYVYLSPIFSRIHFLHRECLWKQNLRLSFAPTIFVPDTQATKSRSRKVVRLCVFFYWLICMNEFETIKYLVALVILLTKVGIWYLPNLGQPILLSLRSNAKTWPWWCVMWAMYELVDVCTILLICIVGNVWFCWCVMLTMNPLVEMWCLQCLFLLMCDAGLYDIVDVWCCILLVCDVGNAWYGWCVMLSMYDIVSVWC